MLPGATILTVAAKKTLCRYVDGFAEEMSSVLVLALFTVCTSVPLLLAKLLSPL